jgi:hypothetical protein
MNLASAGGLQRSQKLVKMLGDRPYRLVFNSFSAGVDYPMTALGDFGLTLV